MRIDILIYAYISIFVYFIIIILLTKTNTNWNKSDVLNHLLNNWIFFCSISFKYIQKVLINFQLLSY